MNINEMKMDDVIARINALYHKSQSEGLTDAEKEEQALLRRRYIDSVKGNLQGQLDNMSVKYPDGTIKKVEKVHGK